MDSSSVADDRKTKIRALELSVTVVRVAVLRGRRSSEKDVPLTDICDDGR